MCVVLTLLRSGFAVAVGSQYARRNVVIFFLKTKGRTWAVFTHAAARRRAAACRRDPSEHAAGRGVWCLHCGAVASPDIVALGSV